MPDPARPSFFDSLPRVTGIGALRRPRSVPVVQQTGATECGLASLASVLAFHGRHIPVHALRDHLTPGRDGTTAADLLDLGERNGLAGRGLRVDAIEDLRLLQRGSILHWRFSHFVVLDRAVKLALARALAKAPEVLLLDEATSHLDTKLEAKIQARLSRLSCTRIVIAQRLNTVRNADRILVLKEGRLVEEGRHEELMGLEGEYASLVRAHERGGAGGGS